MYSIVNSIFHFSYLDLDYPASRLTVTGLARVYCIIIIIVIIIFINTWNFSVFFSNSILSCCEEIN
jgi:hypothetical protein